MFEGSAFDLLPILYALTVFVLSGLRADHLLSRLEVEDG